MWKQTSGDEFPMWPHYVIIVIGPRFLSNVCSFSEQSIESIGEFSPWSFPNPVLCYPYSTLIHPQPCQMNLFFQTAVNFVNPIWFHMIPYDAQHISALHRKVFSGKKHDTSSFSNALQFALGIFEQQKTQRKPDRVPAESPGHTMIFNKPLLIVFGGNNGQQVNVGCILKHVEAVKDTSFIPLQVSKCHGFYICFYICFLFSFWKSFSWQYMLQCQRFV